MKLNLKTCGYGIAALSLLLGRYPLSWLLSSRNAKKPRIKTSSKEQGTYIASPTGNVLFVKSEGPIQATPIVFIHGINSSGKQWLYQQHHFCEKHRLIFIDLPGHGRSAEPRDLSVKALSIDLSTVLTQLNISRPVLYGHSLGGMVIQEYCKQNLSPQPAAIILHSCSHTNPLKTMPISPLPWLLQWPVIIPALQHIARNNNLFTTLGYFTYSSGLSALFYRFVLFTGNQSAASLRTMATFAVKTNAKTTAGTLLATFEFDAEKSLKNITLPCLILASKHDRLIAPQAALYLQKHIKGSEMVMINGGHQSLAEYPEETNLALENFLGKNGI